MKRHGIALLLLVAGCGYPLPGAHRERLPQVAQPSPLRAAARRVDITPPPGVSTFGYATDSRVSDGVWTRLYCRVFAFETAEHARLAIVPCDLTAVSTLLQREVAARVADVLPATRLMLSATHTHAGPAHYYDTYGFNNAFSTTLPGFDPALVSLLARRIAAGIHRAFAATRPAVLRWGHYEGGDGDANNGLWGLARNRSLEAHDANQLVAQAPAGLPRALRAIDPSLHVLRIDELGTGAAPGGPIGALALFAMHPTVLSHRNRLLGADTHGVASREVERVLRAEWHGAARDPLAGLINTNEGDIAPNWQLGTKSEAIEIGRKIAARILALLPPGPPPPARPALLDVRYREVDLPLAQAELGRLHGRLCEVPEPGESFAHGACDHPAEFDADLLFPGAPFGEACQWPKRGLAGSLGALIAGGNSAFPSRIPLAVVRLDDTLISFVPAELTIAAGALVRGELLRQSRGAPSPPAHAVSAGLSNGYMLYVTTPREFWYRGPNGGCRGAGPARQSYEAGSNLYGPWTGVLLAQQLGLLARSLHDPAARATAQLEPAIGEATSFRVSTGFERPRVALARPPRRATLSAEPQLSCTLDRDTPAPTLCFAFEDLVPGAVPSRAAAWLELRSAADRLPVAIDGRTVDDRGWNFVTRIRALAGDRGRWSALLHLSADEWAALADEPVFVSVGWARSGPPVPCSTCAQPGPARFATFTAGALPPACDAQQAQWCGVFDELRAEHPPWDDDETPKPESCEAK